MRLEGRKGREESRKLNTYRQIYICSGALASLQMHTKHHLTRLLAHFWTPDIFLLYVGFKVAPSLLRLNYFSGCSPKKWFSILKFFWMTSVFDLYQRFSSFKNTLKNDKIWKADSSCSPARAYTCVQGCACVFICVCTALCISDVTGKSVGFRVKLTKRNKETKKLEK